jgi:hypothetical protein
MWKNCPGRTMGTTTDATQAIVEKVRRYNDLGGRQCADRLIELQVGASDQ